MFEPTVTVRSLPTSALLGLLVGDVAAETLAGRPLADLFHLHARQPKVCETEADYRAVRILGAAKELLTRALAETVQSGDCLDSPEKVRDLLRLRFADLPHEVFAVVLLDAQHRVLDVAELFRGTLSQTSVYPREVVKLALEANAAAVILVHNHPSGSLEPSTADVALTDTLKKALALVDVRVLDHFIVAGNATPLAFSERGLL
ncbi:JAB domain-containing protein [Zoogloea oryzae]|uniref:JAB domain-containing protein n=1 Tax=Zoogloea oryzae TaxID=310767 RepID=UPI003F67675F